MGLYLLLWWVPLASAGPATVSVPVYLDYPLLRQILVTQLFATPDGSKDLLDDPGGCNRIRLANPQIAGHQQDLEVRADVSAQLGVTSLNGCQQMSSWQGSIGLLGRPVIEAGGRKLRLQPQSMWLIDGNGQKITSGPLWAVGNANLRALLAGFVIDLTPYFESLDDFLPAVLPGNSREQLQALLGSLTLGELQVTPETLNVAIQMQVDLPDAPPQPVEKLSEQELAELEIRWQMMDALLAGAVKYYATNTDMQDLRDALLDVLLDSRYRLRDALTLPQQQTDDAVRHWFIDSWQRLGPVVRRIALQQQGQQNLIWLSVVTATDALHALDQLGPAVGLDISSNGLRQLARMINAGRAEELLRYSEEVDPELQQLLRQQIQTLAPDPSAMHLRFSLFPEAHAAARNLDRWVPTRDDLGVYLPQVAALLNRTAKDVAHRDRLDSSYRSLYRNMVLATAWQESCWRQYVVIDKRIEPLRSGSGDVGIMQVNERVWRGFYDLNKLRWNIDYNSSAGAEVLLNYLVRYALPQGEHKRSGGVGNLARSSYSAYNGGPGQVSRYRRSNVAAGHRRIDQLFWEKYRQVDAGDEMNVAGCLNGDAATAAYSPPPRSTATATKDAATSWVRSQPRDNLTLQLGAYSTRQAAANFITEQALPAPVYVLPVQRAQTAQYLVLYGSFASREQAEPAKRRYSRLQPWLRRFGDLQ